MSNALHLAIIKGMILIFNELFPDVKIQNDLPDPLSTNIKRNLKYTNVLNYFSELNNK
jgi:hypothetical protein